MREGSSDRSSRFEAALFYVLCAIALLAPIPFGSNRLWSWSLLGLAVALVLALWAVALAVRPDIRLVLERRFAVPAILVGFVVGFIVVQAACWTPPAWHNPAWSLTSVLEAADLCTSISIDRYATMTGLARLLTYVAAFWLALQLSGSSRRAHLFLRWFSMAVALYAAYGLVLYFAGIEYILWFPKWAYFDFVTSTFVNRNTFATFAGMGMVCSFALFLDTAVPQDGGGGGLRRFAERISTGGYTQFLCFVVSLVGLVLSASRAGFAAACLALVAVAVLWSIRVGRASGSGLRLGSLGAVLLGVLLLVAVGGGVLVERLGQIEQDATSRTLVIGTTFMAIADRPWLGVGYGTFPQAWEMLRPSGLPYHYNQTHSTYVENAFELGIPAALALYVAVAWLMWLVFRGVMVRRRDAVLPLASGMACLVPVIHSAIDFSLQMPAITLLFSVLLGLGVRQSMSSRRTGG